MRQLFAPKDSESEATKVFELLSGLRPGETITYKQLDVALGRRFTDRRTPYYRAKERLLKRYNRTMAPVPGIGYRMVTAAEHVEVGALHSRKAERSTGRAYRTVTHARFEEVDGATRRLLVAAQQTYGNQLQIMRRQRRKQMQTEWVLDQARTRRAPAEQAHPA
jgi:hypothetical protein